MAEIVKNEKDFKVIQMTSIEVANVFGGMGICDWCGCAHLEGYYISVLNHWYCKADYKMFLERAVNHAEDRNIENLNFMRVLNLLNIKNG